KHLLRLVSDDFVETINAATQAIAIVEQKPCHSHVCLKQRSVFSFEARHQVREELFTPLLNEAIVIWGFSPVFKVDFGVIKRAQKLPYFANGLPAHLRDICFLLRLL